MWQGWGGEAHESHVIMACAAYQVHPVMAGNQAQGGRCWAGGWMEHMHRCKRSTAATSAARLLPSWQAQVTWEDEGDGCGGASAGGGQVEHCAAGAPQVALLAVGGIDHSLNRAGSSRRRGSAMMVRFMS